MRELQSLKIFSSFSHPFNTQVPFIGPVVAQTLYVARIKSYNGHRMRIALGSKELGGLLRYENKLKFRKTFSLSKFRGMCLVLKGTGNTARES